MLEKMNLKTKILEALPWSESEPERKGWRGVLFKVRTDEGLACLKTLRGKIQGTSLKGEAEMLLLANKVGVGPKFIEYDEANEILLMEFIQGQQFKDWLPEAGEEEIQRVVRGALEQGHKLDLAGIDHGQLSWAPKHILIGEDGKVTLIDFERASAERQVNNLSSLVAFLLVNPHGNFSMPVVEAFGLGKEKLEKIKALMKTYRETEFKEGYDELKKILEG